MAEKHTADKEGKYKVVSGPPDFCIVGTATVPFDISRTCDKASVYSPSVNARGKPVLRVGDVVAGVDGDAGKGVASGTAQGGGDNVIVTGTPKVNANGGLPVARDGSVVLMNVGGAPNTVGQLVVGTSPPVVPINGGAAPCNDPPKTSDRLKELQAYRDKLAFMDPDQLDEYVRFNDTSKILDGWISNIDVTNDGSFLGAAGNYSAQAARGVLGFVKDGALGLGNLLYSGAKFSQKVLNPGVMLLDQVDKQILMENIRLGNICLETLKRAAKAAGKELTRPVVEAWEKGNYVEAVVRGGLEIGTLVTAVGDVAKLATAARAGEVGTAAGTIGRETGAVSREVGAVSREVGAAGREGAAIGNEGSAAARELGAKPPEIPAGGAPKPPEVPAAPKAPEPGPAPKAPEPGPAPKDGPGGQAPKDGPGGQAPKEGPGGKGPKDGPEGQAGKDGEGGKAPKEEEAPKKGEDGTKVRKPNETDAAFGERITEEELKSRGFERISKDKHPNANGIDGVYKNKNPPPEYAIVESKYGSSRLRMTKLDELQMSDTWVNGTNSGFDRLADAVGRDTAATIRTSIANGGVDKVLANIDSAGNVTFQRLGANGRPTGPWP